VIAAAVTAKAVLGALAMMVVQGSVLALIALVIVRGRRLRPAWQAGVWLVVLAKFLLPWGPALPWSLADVIASLRGEVIGGPIVIGAPGAGGTAHAGSLGGSLGWLALAAVWAAGTLWVVARAVVAHHETYAAARRGGEAPETARSLLAELAARVRVRTPRLVVGDPTVGPHVVGALRPIIVIPPALAEPAEHELLRAALMHELAHVRRHDALGRIVQLAARALFWFWPVVRLASRRLELAREAACDAWALEACALSRPAYARLLLRMAQLRAVAAPALAAPHALGDRVAGVLGPPVRPRLGVVHKLALVAWIAVALGGARTAEARGEKSQVCIYSPELAEALRLSHPEADADGDGVLSRSEACDYQAEVLRRTSETDRVSKLDDATAELLAEPLCCNCDAAEGLSRAVTLDASCPSEGVDP